MKIKSKKAILSIIAISCIPHLSQADNKEETIINWDYLSKKTDSWKQWAFNKAAKVKEVVWSDENTEPAKTPDNKKDESKEELNGLDAEDLPEESDETPKVDFYDSLGVNFLPAHQVIGSNTTLNKRLTILFENNKNLKAIAYFIQIERKNHALAISMLESMDPAHRLIILLESPAKFIAKILVDIRNQDFKGKTLYHWGPFELKSEYLGEKIVEEAEIKGESVSLRYISFLILHNTNNREEYGLRSVRLAEILECVSEKDLPSLLVYTREEAAIKMGQKHDSCFGAVKDKGYCDEETENYLPTEFVGQLLNFMHTQNKISNKGLVSILESEFKFNQARFQGIFKQIDSKIIQKIIINLSDEILDILPDDIILSAIPSLEEDAKTLKLTDGSNKSKKVILPSNDDETERKEDL